MNEDQARAAMVGIPDLAGYDGPLERMGGLTNLVYKAGDCVLRIPGPGTEEYINREHEAVAAKAAAAAGVSPSVLYCDAKTGVMVTRFVDGAVTMTPQAFESRQGSPARAGLAFRKLHTSGAQFPFRFELFEMIDDYLGILATKDVAFPTGYHDALAQADIVRTTLASQSVALAPCHCDPLCENFLDDGTRMWIVDWEYSGMNDPMWDLGDLSVEGGFDQAQDDAMLSAYFDDQVRAEDRSRMVIYKAMCDLLWTLWGLIQLANNNTADDFRAYSDSRFARCRREMASSGFAEGLATLGGNSTRRF